MKKIFLLLTFLLIFQTASAVIISEIMYDLDGSDAKREWIEIYNNGEDVDLGGWKFYEAETNHRLAIKQGSAVLESGEYAVIADNSDIFLADNSDYSGILLDSTFSLSNKGETLILRDSDKEDITSVTYSSSLGAKGDGDSLQLVDDDWCSGEPTPGEENECYSPATSQEKSELKEEDLAEETSAERLAKAKREEQEEEEKIENQEEESLPTPVSEPINTSQPPTTLLKSPEQESRIKEQVIRETEPKITGAVIYESENVSESKLSVYFFLTLSIALNIVFLIVAIINHKPVK